MEKGGGSGRGDRGRTRRDTHGEAESEIVKVVHAPPPLAVLVRVPSNQRKEAEDEQSDKGTDDDACDLDAGET